MFLIFQKMKIISRNVFSWSLVIKNFLKQKMKKKVFGPWKTQFLTCRIFWVLTVSVEKKWTFELRGHVENFLWVLHRWSVYLKQSPGSGLSNALWFRPVRPVEKKRHPLFWITVEIVHLSHLFNLCCLVLPCKILGYWKIAFFWKRKKIVFCL